MRGTRDAQSCIRKLWDAKCGIDGDTRRALLYLPVCRQSALNAVPARLLPSHIERALDMLLSRLIEFPMVFRGYFGLHCSRSLARRGKIAR